MIDNSNIYTKVRKQSRNHLPTWLIYRVDTNSGMDYWTELFSIFGYISEFIFGSLLLMIYKYLATMDDCNNDNNCLLQCFHK